MVMMWVILGGRCIRAHNGNAYFYQNSIGAWETFIGLFPDYIFSVVKETLLQVEGLFRAFEGDVPRSEKDLLKAIQEVFQKKGDLTSDEKSNSLSLILSTTPSSTKGILF